MGVIAKYKFNQNTYANFIPEFNTNFTDYTITDEIDTDGYTIRIIGNDSDNLPTLIRFGYISGGITTTQAKSLLSVEYINTSNVTDMSSMFRNCTSLTSLNLSNFDTGKVTDMNCMFHSCSALTSLDVSSFDTSSVTNMGDMFRACTSLTSLDVSNFNTSKVTDMSNMFNTCKLLTSLDLSNFNTSQVTNVNSMFSGCSALTSLNLSKFNTGEVTSMDSMFYNCSKLTSLDISNFNTSKVTTMSNMFYNCYALTSLNVSNFNTGEVTTMASMFYNCSKLKVLDLSNSNFDTSKVTSMSSMFSGCYSLTSLDLSNFNTGEVINMGSMFYGCSALTSLDLSNFNTSKVTSMSSMFHSCKLLTSLDVSSFNTSKVTTMSSIFYTCTSLTSLDLSNWDTSKVTNKGTMFKDWTSSQKVYASSKWTLGTDFPPTFIITFANTIARYTFDNSVADCLPTITGATTSQWGYSDVVDGNTTTRIIGTDEELTITNISFQNKTSLLTLDYLNFTNAITNATSMFHGCTALTSINALNFNTSNVTSMTNMFYNCSKLQTLNLSNFDTSNVTSMGSTFLGCTNLTTLDIGNFDTSSVTNMGYMFNNCNNLTTLDVSNFNTSKVTRMPYMFSNCTSLQTLDVSNWDTSKVTDMIYMFNGCSKLQTLDVSKWDTKNVGNMTYLFNGCSKLQTLDTSGWDTKNVGNMANMFTGCNSLVSLDLSRFDTSSVTNLDQIFRNMVSLQSLNVSGWDVSKVTSMTYGFSNCKKLKELDLSSFVFNSNCNCNYLLHTMPSLEVLDFSNYSTPKVGNYLLSNTKLKTIGMLYSSAESINEFTSKLLLGDTSETDPYDMTNTLAIYYYDADPSQLTPVEGVTFKKYAIPTTIQLPPHIQLHGLPNGARDEVDIKTGILTQRVGFLDLNTIETWKRYSVDNPIFTGNLPLKGKTPSGPFAATGVVSNPYYENTGWHPAVIYGGSVTKPCIAINETSVALNFRTTVFTTPQEILAYQPVSIFYELAEPVTTKLILNYNNSCDYGRILPTGMCDKYDVVNSMYTQTMTSILLDGANTWDGMQEMTNVVKFTATGTTVGVENLNMLGAGGLYCDNDLFPNINDDSDVEHCRVDEAGNKFYIYISKDRLMSPDLIGWQIWLQTNKFNMIYELAEHLTYVKPYEELDPTQARWEGMDCTRDGAIKYRANNSDNITLYPTLEYVAPSINNFEVPMLEPNTEYTIYAEGINTNDTINLGGTDINFNNGTVYTSGHNQWLRIDNNDSFHNMVITKGDTTGEHVPYFKGMTSVENPVVDTTKEIPTIHITEINDYVTTKNYRKDKQDVIIKTRLSSLTNCTIMETGNQWAFKISYNATDKTITVYNFNSDIGEVSKLINNVDLTNERYMNIYLKQQHITIFIDGVNVFDNIKMGYETAFSPSDYIYYYNSIKELMIFEDVDGISIESNIGGSKVSYTDLKLRSLPNGVKDTINVVTGELTQRVGEVTFDGSDDEIWNRTEIATGSAERFTISLSSMRIETNGNEYKHLICDKYKAISFLQMYDNGVNGVASWNHGKSISIKNGITNLTLFKAELQQNPVTIQYELEEPIITKLDPQTLLAYTNGTINLSSDTGLLPTTHYTVPSTNTFHLPSMKTGTRYTLKYPSASGSITIGDINYSISSDSMLFTTPLKINGDTSAIIFSDSNPENVILLEGAYNTREVPFFTGVKSVKNPNITIIDQLSTESTTYNCETEIELRGLPNGVADKLDIIKGKLTTNVGVRPYQEGDENLPNIWTDGYETVYALGTPIVKNVTIDHPTVTTNSLIELSSDYLIPQLNYRAPSSNNFPLDLLQPNTTYTLYADTLVSGSYTLGGTKTGVYSQPHTITLADMTDNLLTFNGDLGLSNVMLVKGNSLKTTLPPYFLGIRSVTDGHLLIEGMAGEVNELTFDEDIVLRDTGRVKDTIDLITGTLTKRTGEIILTGTEGWSVYTEANVTDGFVLFRLRLTGVGFSSTVGILCDKFNHQYMQDALHDKEGIYTTTNMLSLCVKESTIGGNTVNALKTWLNQNHTTVVYGLATQLEIALENVWTTLPPTSYDNQTEISSTVSSTSLKPMISVTIATTTLEEIVSQLEQQNAELQAQNKSLEQENVATMLALTNLYETMIAPMAVMSLDSDPYAMSTMSLDDEEPTTNVVGYTVSPMGMVYAKLVHRGLKTMDEVPYNLQVEVMYALKGME